MNVFGNRLGKYSIGIYLKILKYIVFIQLLEYSHAFGPGLFDI